MLGLVSGILNARRTGIGCDVDVSLLDTAISLLNYQAIWTLNRGYKPQRHPDSAHPTIVPAQLFQTQDSYLVIFCAKEKFWRTLTEVMEAPDLAADPRYTSFAGRYEHRQALVADLKERFLRRKTDDWLACLRGRVPCAPVNSLEEALRDEQVLARDMIMDVEHPLFGHLRQVRTAIKVTDAVDHKRPGPVLGADTEDILRTVLGYTDEAITALRRAEVI